MPEIGVLFIIDTDLYKQQGAAFSRYYCYAKALSCRQVTVLISSYQNPIYKRSQIWTDRSGVNFIGEAVSSSKRIVQLRRMLLFWFSTYFLAKLTCRKELNFKRVFWTPKGLFSDLLTIVLLKGIMNYRIVCEKNELCEGLAISNKIPTKVWLGTVMNSLNVALSKQQDKTVSFYDHVIAISTRMTEWVKGRNSRVTTIPILIDTDCISPEIEKNIPKKASTFSMGFFGTIDNEKEGILDFIGLLSRYFSDDNYTLDIFGFTTDKKIVTLQKLVKDLGIHVKVRYMGSLSGEESRKRMADYDLLVLPRKKNLQNDYGFSTKLGEYLVSGSAVLVTDVSDNSTLVKHKYSGLLVSPDSEADLVDALRFSIDNRCELPVFAARARAHAIQKLSYQIYSDTIYNCFY